MPLRHYHTCLVLLLLLCSQNAYANEQKKVLMLLWRGITATELSFKKHLAQMGINATYTEVSGDQNRTKLGAKLREIQPDLLTQKYDIIYSYGTTVTTMLSYVNHERTPVVFNIVFDPVGANLVDSLAHPGRNITGVTNGVPIADQLNAFQRITPFRNMVLFFTAREKNANLLAKRVRIWAERCGVGLTQFRVAPDTNAVDKALEKIRSGKVPCDMVYAGADTYLASRAVDINAAIGKQVPLYGGTATFVKKGWLGAYAAPLDAMGRAAAERMKQILSGADPGVTPVILPQPSIILSEKVMKHFGLTPPSDIILKP